MASLLEVGTGFHPELTGRENIFLNGAILGMTKGEIKRKLDEIIDFSGCALYIDTPVKRYSSGMTVRLGFAVAAFLDPEILIVDEVLAVGDAEFQKKAIGKMQDISRGEGRTVLFVSHNMDAVSKLCNRVITIKNGSIKFDGNVFEGVSCYLEENLKIIKTNTKQVLNILGKNVALNEILFSAENGIVTGERLKVSLCLQNISKNVLKEIRISIGLFTEEKMQMVIDNSMVGKNISLEIQDEQRVDFIIDMFPLGIGKYQVVVYIESSEGFELSWNSHSMECVSNKIFGNNTLIRNEWPQNLTFTKFSVEKI
jgi:lipopolysaccharide transport system ATP-binding protein